MERNFPRELFLLGSEANVGIELNTNGEVPLQRLAIEFEVHFIVRIYLVLRSILIEQRLHVC
jgi:hypothetical protein